MNEPVDGSRIIAGVKPALNSAGVAVPIKITVTDVFDSDGTTRLVVELPDRTLRNLGIVSLGSGTSLIGQIAASSETGTVYNGTTALTPLFAKISASSSGDNTLVSAVTSKKIRVLAYNFISNGTVNAKFQSGASGTDLTGLKYLIANTGICAPFNPAGWFETASATLLNLNLSGGVAVGGELVYVTI